MLEVVPKKPYKCSTDILLSLQEKLERRRAFIQKIITDNFETNDKKYLVVTMTSFPRLGCPFSTPPAVGKEYLSKSNSMSDDVIFPHVRFHTLTKNIRLRRGRPVTIMSPLYKDVETPRGSSQVYMDAICYGMGCSCLQQTFQVKDEDAARYLYDQLAILSPFMLALSAASPIHKGHLLNTDSRWYIISQSVDDRTDEELQNVYKSRV
jgi:glutamate--cysteine ligase catalytic subunit